MRPVLPLFPALVARAHTPALRVGEQALSYAELAEACAVFHARLRALGVQRGQRIALFAHPDLESLVGLVGALTSGAVLVPVNPASGEQELAHIMRDAEPVALFSSRAAGDAARVGPRPLHPLAVGASADSGATLAIPDDSESACLVLYTSGTTGAPKGALLSARNIAATLDGLEDAWQLSQRDTLVHALPLFHAHGLVFGLCGALRVGACLEFVTKFSPEAIARALSGQSRVLYAVPTMYHRIAETLSKEPASGEAESLRAAFSGARLLVSGSAALAAREHARLEALTGQRICERYGLSETLINTAVRADGERRPGFVGVPLPGVEIKLVDDARQPIASQGEDSFGEVAVRGPNVFLGYLNKPEATAAVRDDEGFFYTGDLGTLAADGYLRIVGRKATDIIKSGGFKIGAGEIEGALLEHEAVREVAVLGLPDPDLGERIVAFVVAHEPTPAPETLIDLVSRALGKHKRPREIRYVESLPRNAMGKVQKAQLR
jgi:malonyl-CoA/methylmalonyl-CoA synthetase